MYKLQTRHHDSPTPFYILAGVLFVVIVGVSSLTFRRLSKSGDGYVTPLQNSAASAPQTQAPSKILGVEKVKSLAAAEAPHANVANVQLQQEKNGQLVYVVSLTSGSQLAFDAQTGDSLADVPKDATPVTPTEAPKNNTAQKSEQTATSTSDSTESTAAPPAATPTPEPTPSEGSSNHTPAPATQP